jgi:hypothetical protein
VKIFTVIAELIKWLHCVADLKVEIAFASVRGLALLPKASIVFSDD